MNKEQARSMANFFLDVAKGIVLGLFGFSAFTSVPAIIKFTSGIFSLIIVYFCIKLAMELLKE